MKFNVTEESSVSVVRAISLNLHIQTHTLRSKLTILKKNYFYYRFINCLLLLSLKQKFATEFYPLFSQSVSYHNRHIFFD
jgi:hypothetical protein